MIEPTNDTRAARAKAALDAYAAVYGEVVCGDTISDLLADLHHYLKAEGDENPIDSIEDSLRSAVHNFEEEVREEA
jgi:hypothetical protein